MHEFSVSDEENWLIEQIKSTNLDVFQLVVSVSVELTYAGFLRYHWSRIANQESWIQLLKSSLGPISEQVIVKHVNECRDRNK